jgi:hypothetical protein
MVLIDHFQAWGKASLLDNPRQRRFLGFQWDGPLLLRVAIRLFSFELNQEDGFAGCSAAPDKRQAEGDLTRISLSRPS